MIPNSLNLVRMLSPLQSRTNLKLGHVEFKTRLLGQITEKHCVHYSGHSFDPKFIKLCQNINSHKI